MPVTAVPDDSEELDREAEWICKYGFTKEVCTYCPFPFPADCRVSEFLDPEPVIEIRYRYLADRFYLQYLGCRTYQTKKYYIEKSN